MEKTRITIIGAGVCGLACSYLLSKNFSDILVIEKNDSFGRETSSRNSEVIHAGIYYPKASLKATLCIEGKNLLYQLCERHKIAYKKIGKLLVATNDDEILKITAIKENAEKNGVKTLCFLTSDEIAKMQPSLMVKTAIFSPETGILDSHQLMKFFEQQSKKKYVEFAYNILVTNIEKTSQGYVVSVREPSGETFSFKTQCIINAAGFDADKIAQMAGINIEQNRYKIYYNKGQYFRLNNPAKFSINHLIYPPPGKTDLGIHVTPDLAGGIRLGPDSRYIENIDYQINTKDKEIFQKSVSRFLKNLYLDDLSADTAGIRAKLQSPEENFRDFVISEESDKGLPCFVNLLGIESPGLTACLAIAQRVQSLIASQL